MSEIVKFNFNSKTITCIVVNGNPWFKAKEVATILGYTNTTQAIIQHIDNDDKQTYTAILETLQVTSLFDRQLEGNEKKTIFINESGLYCLIFGSKKREAKAFKKWVTSEVLPSIRKHGVYETPAAAIQRIRNPTGETELHYQVKKYIEKTYPYVIISAGLGENQTTDFIRMDSKAKGYTKGQPDLELKCKLGNGFTDVVAIELKNPNGSNKTSPEQDAYLERLRGCNVATLVSSSYEEVIIFLHDHYKSVKETHNTLLAIGDQPRAKRIDFSRNDNPAYWCKQLRNKESLLEECRYRGMDTEELWKLPNKQIAIVLISHDKTTVVIHK